MNHADLKSARDSAQPTTLRRFTGRPVTGGRLWRQRRGLMTIGDCIRSGSTRWQMRREIGP